MAPNEPPADDAAPTARNSRRRFPCSSCGAVFVAGARGPAPDNCPECRGLADALTRLERELRAFVERADIWRVLDIRHQIICILSDLIPRPRDEKGRFKPRR